MIRLKCDQCGIKYGINEIIYKCRRCNDLISVEYAFNTFTDEMALNLRNNNSISVWKYRDLLPIHKGSKIISLNEGGTSLHKCRRLGPHFNLDKLYVKNEGENPTGSFKDRGMTVGVSQAVQLGAQKVICASTGNTSSSMSAYAAKAGLESIVIVPSRGTALGKMTQTIAYGANIIRLNGTFDQALDIVMNLVEIHNDLYFLNSVNPFRLEGQKTLAFEICEQLKRVPKAVVVPVGNAGNLSAIWKGFKELYELGLVNDLPKMIGVQAEGAAPIAEEIRNNYSEIKAITEPTTKASAIRIGSPVNWKRAFRALKESNGTVMTVSDSEILNAQKELAVYEGIFVEPASAASIAILAKLMDTEFVTKDEEIVCVTTGNGLKDPDAVSNMANQPIDVDADLEAVTSALAL